MEFEYIYHGTQTLIPNFEIATGQVIALSVGPIRTGEAFVGDIDAMLVVVPR